MRFSFSSPLGVGLLFGLIGIGLTIIGIIRGNVPLHPASISMALVVGGGVWFLVAWAVATAAADVDQDLAANPDNSPEQQPLES